MFSWRRLTRMVISFYPSNAAEEKDYPKINR